MREQFAQKVREAFGRALLNEGTLLALVDHGIKMCIDGDQVNALSATEQRALLVARADVQRARRRVLAVARRCVDETQ